MRTACFELLATRGPGDPSFAPDRHTCIKVETRKIKAIPAIANPASLQPVQRPKPQKAQRALLFVIAPKSRKT